MSYPAVATRSLATTQRRPPANSPPAASDKLPPNSRPPGPCSPIAKASHARQLVGLLLTALLPGFAAAADTTPLLGALGQWPSTPPIVSGRASFYGASFTGRKTASGEPFHHESISAASNRFPLGTLVAVRRQTSARCIVVKINDRMGHRTRLIDLSREAAVRLGMIEVGVTEVDVVPLPKALVGHEHACKLAFSPPIQLHVENLSLSEEKR
ncbi:MAG TPA: septal ring lytic transglycosylase RlpA family protein [Accumulibacter sp.]|uniref:septal ring lytic transglycosylase RlpA family protein n=1 Tax=Accumulibacter sp. TaxID=2053492 RepID=UPI0026338416|nr:septal ring lytic transglycosylase RlpA family protein [Accumulibacter sp.]MDS4055799.1 septal ring lytic transglycosylase RlpA family protein [Accumulibacter sp.]HMV07231.1 septal ring lytic transglycosylase RlpA family protein [Accumulibacter sp.]HMW62264.1 septal ring lytic transglycosylase RlpA family protein [Accumulibacter sp.]HMW79335.1 septal ring lytic transglycosylase RlpA family protein [Accumulibacter sp.]HMX69945.1 septal ring lytic transglycosylase RlpA family protein [Accumul